MSEIPPGEDIIYRARSVGIVKARMWINLLPYLSSSDGKWNTLGVFTSNGCYYTIPLKGGKPAKKLFIPYENIWGVTITGGGLKLTKKINLQLINFERNKKMFRAYARDFFLKILPIIIEKKENWLKLNQNNPDVKERQKRLVNNSLTRFKRDNEKILSNK